jgi:hypothetical protein
VRTPDQFRPGLLPRVGGIRRPGGGVIPWLPFR